jgi:acetyl esterase/lipase
MSTLDLVAAEHRNLVGGFAGLFDPNAPGAVSAFRKNLVDGVTSLVSPEPGNPGVVTIPASDHGPELRALIHRPADSTGAVAAIVYFHGGGLLAGTPDMMAGANARIANDTGVVVIAPDYRLAPEHPFPAAVEDAYATVAWVYENAGELGIDPARISVLGDSAGGYLSAAVALLARDRGVVPLRAQFLLYPMLDHRTGSDMQAGSDDPLTGEFVWTRAQTHAAWALSKGSAAIDPAQLGYHSPTYMEDLAGLPPAFLILAGLDLLRDEGIAYAQRLMRAGVKTDVIIYAGAVHAFNILPGEIAERAYADLTAAIRRLG